MYNIIGDVAGQYDALMELVNKMPKDNKVILVGDLVDRGPDSYKVVDWAMNNTNVITIKGNHEQMMVDAYLGNNFEDHYNNGGRMTMQSYGVMSAEDYPSKHIQWMNKLPIFIRDKEGLFVSHAPWYDTYKLGEYYDVNVILWNRYDFGERPGVFQVWGHNHVFEKYDDWGMCIDNCRNNMLVGLEWPSKELYNVQYGSIW